VKGTVYGYKVIKAQEELTCISLLNQSLSDYSSIDESPLQPNAHASSGSELDSHAALQSSSQCEHARDDVMPNLSENPCRAVSLTIHTCEEQVVGAPSHRLTNFTTDIPGFLSPYPSGEGFSARDSNRYVAFCGFRITKNHLQSS
jgi:hypothetical protein